MDYHRLVKETEAYGFPYKAIILIGPPGSGKGTCGRFLSRKTKSFYFSLGDLYRKFTKATALGKVFHDFASKAQALPDDYANTTCLRALQSNIFLGNYNPISEIAIIDGYPKTEEQFIFMCNFISVIAVINLRCSQKEAMARIFERQKTMHRVEDSTGKLIECRLLDFEIKTKPILALFKSVGVPIHTFDTECDLGQVNAKILSSLLCYFTSINFDKDNSTERMP